MNHPACTNRQASAEPIRAIARLGHGALPWHVPCAPIRLLVDVHGTRVDVEPPVATSRLAAVGRARVPQWILDECQIPRLLPGVVLATMPFRQPLLTCLVGIRFFFTII